MTLGEIYQLLDKAKQIGIEEMEWNGLRIKFPIPTLYSTPSAFAHIASDPIIPKDPMQFAMKDLKAEDLVKPPSILDDLSAEEVLYAATPYFDVLQAEKAQHQEKLNEEKV